MDDLENWRETPVEHPYAEDPPPVLAVDKKEGAGREIEAIA